METSASDVQSVYDVFLDGTNILMGDLIDLHESLFIICSTTLHLQSRSPLKLKINIATKGEKNSTGSRNVTNTSLAFYTPPSSVSSLEPRPRGKLQVGSVAVS